MLVCSRITDFIWRLNSCLLPLVARRFPQARACHPRPASPGLPDLHGDCDSKAAGLGKLRATALGWIIRGLWAVEQGPWIMDHESRLFGASATGTEKDRDGPSHAAGLDVLMVT